MFYVIKLSYSFTYSRTANNVIKHDKSFNEWIAIKIALQHEL